MREKEGTRVPAERERHPRLIRENIQPDTAESAALERFD
jgi:hypothetical protein